MRLDNQPHSALPFYMSYLQNQIQHKKPGWVVKIISLFRASIRHTALKVAQKI